jgi:cytochrome P450
VKEGSTPAGPATASGCPVADAFRPFDIADPFEFYARARAQAPVFFSDELGFWVVSRYDDVLAILKDPRTFSSENTQAPYKARPAEVQRILDEGDFRAYSGLSARQPPEHTRLRGFIKKAFTPRRVAALEPQVRELAVAMIERFEDAGRADLVAELAHELPALVIFRLLGIPDADVPSVKEWAASRVLLNFGDAPLADQVRHAENLVAYWRYCLELIAARFERPRDDLPSDLVRIYRQGEDEISIEEMAGLVYGQLTAGHETTTALLANGLKELLLQRERWVALCAEPELIPTAVEELLRISTPVFAWKRKVRQPAAVGGVKLSDGDNVLLLLGSANHDETVFADPEAIDLRRANARNHLSFGHGIHFCLGASLARLEAQVVLEELTRRLPGLRLAPGQEFDYTANTTFRAPARVLAEWERSHVREFGRCGSGDAELVGGKVASLGTLTGAGFPVPPGFAVTTDAYAEHLRADGLGDGIAAELAAGGTDDAAELERRSARIRGLVEAQPLPAAIEREIRRAYADLCAAAGLGSEQAPGPSPDPVPVAVRSSATAEDSADASFAGLQDTYLWVVGEAEVLRAVKRCWASLFTARSIAYRHDREIEHASVQMAVAVQRMVLARSAGVAMTLNPSNGDRSKIAIESSFGLGETVVGGEVTPDAFLLDKVMLDVVSSRIAAKHVELVPDEAGHGVRSRPIEPERQTRPSLSAAEVREVAALAKRCERHYGCPQDVEWAIDAAAQPPRVVLLQSRPESAWARRPAPAVPRPATATGLASLVNTLINPLAARRPSGVDADD